MTTKELDKSLMGQYTIESMLDGSGTTFNQKCSEDPNIAAMQLQGPTWCLRTKGFLCSHYTSQNSPEGKFCLAMKVYMEKYKSNEANKQNKAMKGLYNLTEIDVLAKHISMLAMHAQFKDSKDINDVEKEIEIRSLDPESVSIAIALYIYFTILVNNSLDALSYNELFIKSYHDYYNYWMSRRLMLQMHGNSWKNDFNGVLLA